MTEKQLREIDALVAEKVMGWKRQRYGVEGVQWFEPRGNSVWLGPTIVPAYTKDIAVAWQVRDKFLHWEIKSNQFDVRCELGCFEDGPEGSCTIGESVVPLKQKGEGDFVMVEDVTPLAICLAALKAVGVEYGKSE